MKPIEWRFEDIGLDQNDYFPGRGVAKSVWKEVFVGVGDNPREAAEDALEQAAESDWELGEEIESEAQEFKTKPAASGEDEYYFVALYLR